MIGIDFIRDFTVVLIVAALVGWGCHRLRIPVVFGYLVAGIAIGPGLPEWGFVRDLGRIQTFSQVGLVFVMFAVGLRLRLRKVRRMGFGIFGAVLGGALLIYYLSRLVGTSFGLIGMQTTFFAAMIMISSSTIVSKILQEVGMTHERAGQIAMGVTVLEGIVGVLALTLLNSYMQFGGGFVRAPLGEIFGQFTAFVILAGIGGLLLVPWLLRRMTTLIGEELKTVSMVGLLFTLAILARYAGYSLALGAFLLGAIVAETPHRNQVERKFEGLRDVFSALFFVAIGMQIEVRALVDYAGTIVGVSLFTLVVRMGGSAIGLVLVGTPLKDAWRAGLSVTPIGEFSLIIAQIGVNALFVPSYFFPLAVGVCLATTLMAPWLTRSSGPIAEGIVRSVPGWLNDWVVHYHGWIGRVQAQEKRNLLWQLSKKRVVQVSVGVLLVSGLLVFSERILEAYTSWLGRDFLAPDGLTIVFWVLLGLVALAPLVAIWRNLSAMALLYAQVATHGMPNKARVRPLLETALKTVGGAAIFVWLSSLLPSGGAGRWLVAVSAAAALLALLVLRRKLIYWHSELEVELREMLASGDTAPTDAHSAWLRPHLGWNLNLGECTLPDLADCQGKRIAELDLRARIGCTLVGIERQGFIIALPGPDAVLYPGDKVLLLGTSEQVAAGKAFLATVAELPTPFSEFDDIRMELLTVPTESRAAELSLLQLSPASVHRVHIAGIQRAGVRILTPGADEVVKAGDELLALGSPDNLRDFKAWLLDDGEGEVAEGNAD